MRTPEEFKRQAEASMNGPYYKGTALDDFKNFASGLQESTFYFRVACNGCDIGTIKYEEKEMAIKDWNKRINQNKTTIKRPTKKTTDNRIKFWVKLCSYDRRLALKKLREGRDVNNKILNQKPKTL